MLALCVSLVFGCCWVFLWWVLPTSWSLCPPPLVFCCAGVGRLCWRWLFRVYKVLMLFSCSRSVVCSHYLVVSPDRSWVELVWLPVPVSPSSVVIYLSFLCWWVSSSRRYPGVHGFYLLFFMGGCRGKVKWFKRAGVYCMIFKVPALREEIGDSLDMYSVNCDNWPTKPLSRKDGKKIRLLLRGGRIVSWI